MQTHLGQALSVSAVAKFIYSIISQNIAPLWIRGEISNIKVQQNGNAFFSIKDPESKINALIMHNSGANKVISELKNGMEILIYGKISYYKKEGYLSIFVEEVEFIGEGLLKQKYDELKKKLEQEGLFAPEHKRKIPEYPRWVGVVTSPTGAAIKDILNITSRRFAGVNIVLFPASVQGECAGKEIAAAIGVANKYASHLIDVLIVGRGGGSIEDLWCFNEEAVARAIYGSKIPVISAVGHEIDYTIADYVADLRAPTPSAAAELVVKDRNEIINKISHSKNRMEWVLSNRMDSIRNFLALKGKDYLKDYMESVFSEQTITLENLKIRFISNFTGYINKIKSGVLLQKEKLDTLNPANILKRGYSLTYKVAEDGTRKAIRSIKNAEKGENITTLLTDGQLESKIQDII
jgi:exodeoxyribonuclease VII large subunit